MSLATLATELIAMANTDDELRARLLDCGDLFGGYHPQMRALHERNAARLLAIVRAHGWPTIDRVGRKASESAWRIAQHSISRPDVMRAALASIEAAGEGLVEKRQLAYLEDRIAVFEGRPQRFGTQIDWDDDGRLSPVSLADPARVDQLRASVGLSPLAEQLAKARAGARREGERVPSDLAAYRAASNAFAREVGWR